MKQFGIGTRRLVQKMRLFWSGTTSGSARASDSKRRVRRCSTGDDTVRQRAWKWMFFHPEISPAAFFPSSELRRCRKRHPWRRRRRNYEPYPHLLRQPCGHRRAARWLAAWSLKNYTRFETSIPQNMSIVFEVCSFFSMTGWLLVNEKIWRWFFNVEFFSLWSDVRLLPVQV